MSNDLATTIGHAVLSHAKKGPVLAEVWLIQYLVYLVERGAIGLVLVP
jgi:hypothetical protein